MKSKNLIYPTIIMVAVFISAGLFAQPSHSKHTGPQKANKERGFHDRHKPIIPDLTDEQKDQIKSIKVDEMKNIQPIKNKIGEKAASLKTLVSSDDAKEAEINNLIDKIYELKAQIVKERLKTRQEIMELLNDEQKVFFNHAPLPIEDTKGHPGRHPRCH